MNPDVTTKDMTKMSLPTAYFSRDVDVSLESYVDADIAYCIDDRHSTSGYAFLLAGGPISWQSSIWRKLQLHRRLSGYDSYWRSWD